MDEIDIMYTIGYYIQYKEFTFKFALLVLSTKILNLNIPNVSTYPIICVISKILILVLCLYYDIVGTEMDTKRILIVSD